MQDQDQDRANTKNYPLITQFFLNCMSWVLLLPGLVVFFFYRRLIDMILTMKVGDKYGGLLERADSFFLAPDPSKCYMTNVMYIKSDEKVDLYEAIVNIFQKKVFTNPDQYPKLTSTIQQFGGYPYWLKDELKVSDTVMPLSLPEDGNLSKEYVREFAAKISNAEYFNDGVYWDLHIATEPLMDDTKDGFFRYVLVSRVHHCICDGTSLVALLIKLLGDASTQNYGVEIFSKLMKHKPSVNKSVTVKLKIIMSMWLDLVFLALGRVVIQTLLIPNDNNSLHGDYRDYSPDKIVAWTTENKPECIPLVKMIKSRSNTQFVCVLGTAVVESLSRYLEKHSRQVPDHISFVMATLLDFPKIDPLQPARLENKATCVMYQFPTTHPSDSITDVLKSNCDMMKNNRKYTESMIVRFIVGVVLGNLPLFMQQPYMGLTKQTMVITNVPGGSQVKMFNGCIVEQVIPLVPNSRGVGLSIAILSYDDRFQVGVVVDKSLQESQEEVQTISDGILDSIRRLYAQSQ